MQLKEDCFIKKKDGGKIKNYRPVRILYGFSKFYKLYLYKCLIRFETNVLVYSTTVIYSYVLIGLRKCWKGALCRNDSHSFVQSILMTFLL